MEKRRIPDLFIALRLALVPVFLGFVAAVDGPELTDPFRMAAAATLAVMGASDWLDGFFARRLGVASKRGGYLDAGADKIATLVPLFYWAVRRPPAFPPVPLWLPAGLFLLDLAMGALWARVLRTGAEPEGHNPPARVATLTVFVLVGAVTLGAPAAVVLALGVASLGLRVVAVVAYALAWSREG